MKLAAARGINQEARHLGPAAGAPGADRPHRRARPRGQPRPGGGRRQRPLLQGLTWSTSPSSSACPGRALRAIEDATARPGAWSCWLAETLAAKPPGRAACDSRAAGQRELFLERPRRCGRRPAARGQGAVPQLGRSCGWRSTSSRGPGSRSTISGAPAPRTPPGTSPHARHAAAQRPRPRALRADRLVRQLRPADEPEPALVQHHLRRLLLRRQRGELLRAARPVGASAPARRPAHAGHHARALPRPGQAGLRLHRLLGLHRVFPVHADLVREHPRGDGGTWRGRPAAGRPSPCCCSSATSSCPSSGSCRATPSASSCCSRRARWVLLMHWVDIYWLVMPGFSPGPRAAAPARPDPLPGPGRAGGEFDPAAPARPQRDSRAGSAPGRRAGVRECMRHRS